MRSISSQVTREGRMMIGRLINTVAIVSFAAALSGCVSYGNTHALVTPVGVAGYHTFKPDVVDPNTPRDIRLSQQRAALERVASNNTQTERAE